MLAAVERNVSSLEYASFRLRSDRAFMLAAVKQNGLALECTLRNLKVCREVVAAAIEEDEGALPSAQMGHFCLKDVFCSKALSTLPLIRGSPNSL